MHKNTRVSVLPVCNKVRGERARIVAFVLLDQEKIYPKPTQRVQQTERKGTM